MQVVRLLELYEQYGDRVQFLFVYISESGHMFPVSVDYSDDAPFGSRAGLVRRVRTGIKHFGFSFPCLIDTEEKEVQNLYDAFPKRMVIIDKAGRIAVDSGHSPGLPFPWKEMRDWLDHYAPSS